MARKKIDFKEYRNNASTKKRIRILSATLFVIGVFLAITFYGIATWADFEASLFDTSIKADETLRSVRCPVIVGINQVSAVRAKIHNTLDRKASFSVRTRVSDGMITLMREENQRFPLEPGESAALEVSVSPVDAVWNRVIMSRVMQNRSYPEPSKSGTCGILVFNFVGLSGNWIQLIWLGIAFVLILVGLYLWVQINQPMEGRPAEVFRAMTALSLVVLAGVVITFLGAWMLALFVFFGNFLLILAMTGYFILYS
jgi:hypothetical protein